MNNLFATCRYISAVEVARVEGLSLKQRGAKWWTCCPLHGERTASLCFFPDGGWKCFGCNAGGDSVSLYAALHGLKPGDAARALAGIFGIVPGFNRLPTPRDQERELRHKEIQRYRQAYQTQRAGVVAIDFLMDECWDIAMWVQSLEVMSNAQLLALNLESLRMTEERKRAG